MENILSPPQVRAARLMLDWTLQDLADKSHVSYATIQRYEAGKMRGSLNALINAALVRAFGEAGIVFLPAGVQFGGHTLINGVAQKIGGDN